MMLQHPGPTLADISCSALVPCLSPPGTLTLDDFADFSPIVKEELRHAIQSKRLYSGISVDMSSDGASSSSDRTADYSGSGSKREVPFLYFCLSSFHFCFVSLRYCFRLFFLLPSSLSLSTLLLFTSLLISSVFFFSFLINYFRHVSSALL